jgi:peptidoglycan/xylan/chitin deacetylase (PgdA/CDA1 family)
MLNYSTNNIQEEIIIKSIPLLIVRIGIKMPILLTLVFTCVVALQTCRAGTLSENSKSDEPLSKTVVLTFDDAAKSHRTFVAPLLKEMGFDATFFITYEWMDDTENFLSWEEVAELHELGFEIGNHCWHHWGFSQPKNAAALEGELGLINYELQKRGIPTPVSYAYDGNGFGPEAVRVLENLGYQFARRGKQPEEPYGTLEPGPGFDPEKHHHLLVPTTCDGYPNLELDQFVKALKSVKRNEIPVLQFHGVPDVAHPWVNTSQENFKKFMDYLKSEGYRVIAMRDLASYLPENPPQDPMLNYRYPEKEDKLLDLPDEVVATRKNLDYWLTNMFQNHNFTLDEMVRATGMDSALLNLHLAQLGPKKQESPKNKKIKIKPYPGVRHPRIGFKDGMLSPMRGTKASIFLPWAPEQFVVLDLPEALFSQLGLTFLGHKHIPTVFDYQKVVIPNSDWTVLENGGLSNRWELPLNIIIGTEIQPGINSVDLKLWMQNNSDTTFTGLKTQVCIMLKEAKQFEKLSNENKIFDSPVVAVHSKNGKQWIFTAWDNCHHAWGNKACPCLHSDPQLQDCKPGETVSVTGKIWFYQGDNIQNELERIKSRFSVLK